MDQLDPTQVAARELVAFAERRGIDLSPLWRDWVFRSEDRLIYFWREEGNYRYTLEGGGRQEPPANSSAPYRGESGVIGGIDNALQLLSAWLLDWKEVDALPVRDSVSHSTN